MIRMLLVILVIAGMLVFPFLAGSQQYIIHLAILCFIYVSLSAGWNILSGLTGQISFGHATFFGVGAYTTAVLWLNGVPPLLTMPFAGMIAAAYGALWGYPCLRLRGPFFAIATIGVGEATRIIVNNIEVIGGASGLSLPVPEVYSKLPYYYLTFAVMLMTLGITALVLRSRFGLGLFAIRENIEAADSLGVNTAGFQLYALMLSGFIVGICGSVYAQYLFQVIPEKVFGFDFSISLILMTVIGGLGSFWGPVIGGILFLLLEEIALSNFPSLHLGIYGGLLMLIMMFEPGGLAIVIKKLSHKIRRIKDAA